MALKWGIRTKIKPAERLSPLKLKFAFCGESSVGPCFFMQDGGVCIAIVLDWIIL